MKAIDKFQRFGQTIYNSQDVLKNHILYKYPIHLTDNTEDHSVVEQYKDEHDYVWIVDKNIETLREFPWWFKPTEPAIYLFPYVYKSSKRVKSWKKVQLVPTKIQTEKKLTRNFICGIYDVYRGKDRFDIFFIGNKNTGTWEQLTSRFSDVQAVSTYQEAVELSSTDMFWIVPDDIIISDFFKFSYQPDDWSQKYIHVFGNGKSDTRDGIALFTKRYTPTARELEYRYYASKKELNIIASKPRPYDRYSFKNYNEYLDALKNSKTEMFWFIPNDVVVKDDFDFNFYIDHQNQFDRNINHVWLNGEHYDGVALFSKRSPITEREFNYRFYVNKKEWNTVASVPKQYDRFVIDNYVDYFKAFETTTTDMFWGIPSDVTVTFDFDFYVPHNQEYDRSTNHVMLNGEHRDGVVLFSKRSPVTEKEIENRFYVNKKDWNIVASVPKQYEKFTIDTYQDYLNAVEKSKTNMFWMIPPEVNVKPDFEFDLYFPHYEKFEREINHVFMNGPAYDGVSLVSKKCFITEKEIKMRFFASKKQYDTVASEPRPYDIVFISNDEEHADENYAKLTERFPRAKRVHGVKGVHKAHIAAAELCSTDMIWIVDADAEIIPKFNFDYYVPAYDPDSRKTVHVWKAQNPINSLVYGYGAVKLLPREMTLNMDMSKPDMTTSISPYFKSVNRISNITRFNTDPFSTWRSAFRETVKLASKSINGQLDEETDFRLNVWCTRGQDKPFGEYCIAGANAGKNYGLANIGNLEALRMINNFDWLKEQFDQTYVSV